MSITSKSIASPFLDTIRHLQLLELRCKLGSQKETELVRLGDVVSFHELAATGRDDKREGFATSSQELQVPAKNGVEWRGLPGAPDRCQKMTEGGCCGELKRAAEDWQR